MENIFKKIHNSKTLIVGVGNPLRADDAFGPALIERIRPFKSLTCIDAGTAPENYLGRIIKEKPEIIIIVDAVHLGLSPGQYSLVPKEGIAMSGFTTHDLSPQMFIDFLNKETGAEIYLLGVQPKDLSFGRPMSKQVKETLEELTRLVKNA